jgi:hypothetical protein
VTASVPFVAEVRSRPGVIRLGAGEGERITVRVEVPEVWDVVRIETPPMETVLAVKNAALQALVPRADQRAWVIKLRGFEVLDEALSLTDAGAVNGSIFLLTHRRRRPVR